MVHSPPRADIINDHVAILINGNHDIMRLLLAGSSRIFQCNRLARLYEDTFRGNFEIITDDAERQNGIEGPLIKHNQRNSAEDTIPVEFYT